MLAEVFFVSGELAHLRCKTLQETLQLMMIYGVI